MKFYLFKVENTVNVEVEANYYFEAKEKVKQIFNKEILEMSLISIKKTKTLQTM